MKWLTLVSLLAIPLLVLPFVPKDTEDAKPAPAKPSRAPASVPPARHAARAPAAPTARSLPELPKLEELHGCYDHDCAFAKGDPREYDYAVGQALKVVLLSLAEKAKAHHLRDPRIAEAARQQLATENGHVQEAALAVLATQDTDPATRDGILQHVIDGYDAEVIPEALRELERYGGDDDFTKIASALSRAMVTGSPFVAQAIASHVSPFVTTQTAPTFEDALASLPDSSVVKEKLRNALRH